MSLVRLAVECDPTQSDYSLADLGLVDTPEEAEYDALTRLAMRLFKTPVALVSVVDEANDRQFFKSQQGLPSPWSDTRQTPLSHSFCYHVKTSGQPLVVPYSPDHPLVRDNPAIIDLNVKSNLGVPIHGPDGAPLGALCVIDNSTRNWSDEDVALIADLASCVSTEIKLRAALKDNMALVAGLEERSKRILDYNALRESIVMAFMAPDLTAEQRFHTLLVAGCRALKADAGVIARVSGSQAEPIFSAGPDGKEVTAEQRAAAGSIFGTVVAGQSLQSASDLARSDLAGLKSLVGTVPGSCIAAPIVLENQLFGAIEFSSGSVRDREWSSEEQSMISIIAMFLSAHLAIYSQINALKRSETALLDQLLATKSGMSGLSRYGLTNLN